MSKTPTDKTDMTFIPIEQTDAVKAARAALTPIRAKHQQLEGRISRYSSVEKRPLVELLNRPSEELKAQVSIGGWREELARTTVALREAEAVLDEAIAAERQKLRAEITRQKHGAIRLWQERCWRHGKRTSRCVDSRPPNWNCLANRSPSSIGVLSRSRIQASQADWMNGYAK